MSLLDWLGLLIVCLLGAISPGPSLFIVTKHALASGRFQGVLVAWSHAFGVGVYALLSILGLNWLTLTYPNLYLGVTYTGALYLGMVGFIGIISKKLKSRCVEPSVAGFMDDCNSRRGTDLITQS